MKQAAPARHRHKTKIQYAAARLVLADRRDRPASPNYGQYALSVREAREYVYAREVVQDVK